VIRRFTMTLRVGHPSKKGVTDTSDARLDFRNKYVCNADGTPRGGVTSPVGTNLLSSTATMNVSVGAFSAVTVRDGGVVEMANDGPVNVLLDAPPSSQSRIDVVFVKQNDSSSTVSSLDANDQAVFGVLKGTASSTPTARTDLPAGALAIGQVLIPSTATATNSGGVVITTTCSFTAASGGRVPFRTLTELQAWTNPSPRQLVTVFADSTTANIGDYVWSGTAWQRAVPKLSHAEYTTNVVGLTDGNGFSAHNYAADAANTTDSTLVTVATPDVTLRDSGEYSVSWTVSMSALSTSAASVLAISLNGTQIAVVSIGTTSSGTIALPNLWVPAAGGKLRFTINKFSGGGCDVNGRVRITKIGG
jgi:hypothetical protein